MSTKPAQIVPSTVVAVLDPEQDNWKTRAACRGMDPAEVDRVFYPRARTQTLQGVQICKSCPVMLACREVTIRDRELWGTRGGLTQWDRAEMWKGSRWSKQLLRTVKTA